MRHFLRDAFAAVAFPVCLLLGVGFFALLGFGAYQWQVKATRADDPYFRQYTCWRAETPKVIEITEEGFTVPGECVRTHRESYRFVNRLTEYPVTLCLGRRGDCETGHESPFPGGRLTLAPGESAKVTFRRPRHHGFKVDRVYPVTLVPVSGRVFTRPDVLVDSQAPESSP